MFIWAIGGGKGGTGKSLVANGLGTRLALRGQRVVLVDADFGGANQHTYCGLRHPPLNLGRFFEAKASLEEVILPTSVPGLRLVAGNLNSANTDGLNSAQKLRFFRHLRKLDADHVVVDLGAGTTYDTLDSFLLADLKVAVITPEPLAVENFYLFVKNLQFRQLGAMLSEVKLRDAARDIWKHRAEHGISGVPGFIEHLCRMSEPFAEIYRSRRRDLFLHMVLNEVREFRQVDAGMAARSAVQKFFQVPVAFAGFVHHDKDLWHQFGQGTAPVLKGASFSMTHDLDAVLDAILKAQAGRDGRP